MPAYNEEGCLEAVVKDMAQAVGLIVGDYKIVIVNDASKDGTKKVLNKLCEENSKIVPVHLEKNVGHGASLLVAYNKAIALGADWVFHVDSDNQFLSSDFIKLWKNRTSSNFLVGRRKNRNDPFHRIVITLLLRLFLFLFFQVNLKDSNVPFRLIRAGYLEVLLKQLPVLIFAPNIFISVLAKRDGQNLCEIPVSHTERSSGENSIVRWSLVMACLRSSYELIVFRLTLNKRIANMK